MSRTPRPSRTPRSPARSGTVAALAAVGVRPGARERRVYLPAGADWTAHTAGDRHPGGGWITVPAPLDRVPFFVRDDADPLTPHPLTV